MQVKLTTKFNGVALFSFHSNTIPTCNKCAIEVSSGIDCCSWCNWFRHHLCDIKQKWRVVSNHPTMASWKKISIDIQWWNVPLVSNRGNCTCECHSFPRTWSLNTALQLSIWNWKWTISLVQTAHKNWLFYDWYKEYSVSEAVYTLR